MQIINSSKAQGAIEYLLIIGAAILIVAIVILAATGILSGGQTQSEQGKESALDALRQLKVTGLGYRIEVDLQDVSSDIFPLGKDASGNQLPNCVDPRSSPPTRLTCFDGPLEVLVIVDGNLIDKFNISGKTTMTTYSTVFKGDPSVKHTLKLDYQDCWSGAAYGEKTVNSAPLTQPTPDNYLYGFNASMVKPSPTGIITYIYNDYNSIIGGTQKVNIMGSLCSDRTNSFYDKNLILGKIKITGSDGKETVIPAGNYSSNYMPDMNFQ